MSVFRCFKKPTAVSEGSVRAFHSNEMHLYFFLKSLLLSYPVGFSVTQLHKFLKMAVKYIYVYKRSAFPSPAVQCNYKHHSNRINDFFVLELLSYVDDHIFGVFWGKNKQMKKQACPVPLSWIVKNMSLSAMVWLTDVLKRFSDNSLGQSAKLGLGCTGTSYWYAEYIRNTYFKNNCFLSVCSGSSSANMGHYREVSRAGFAMPVHQVLADCWHVCFLLYDSCHDSRPAPCHLLPVAGLPRGHSVPLEHSCHGGLGPGTDPQHTAGRKGWTHRQLDFHRRTQDVCLFLASRDHCRLSVSVGVLTTFPLLFLSGVHLLSLRSGSRWVRVLGSLCWAVGAESLRHLDDGNCLPPARPHHHHLSGNSSCTGWTLHCPQRVLTIGLHAQSNIIQ